MGLEIDRETFDDADFEAFDARLRACLEAMTQLVKRPGFGGAEYSLGAEVELDLVTDDGSPCPRNDEVLRRVGDDRVTLEIDRFNIEVNSTPLALAGTSFSALGRELDELQAAIGRAAAPLGARVVPIGILPTLTEADLERSALTDGRRYRAMQKALQRLRRSPFPIEIHGTDSLELAWDDVTMEGANTSLQVHLRIPYAEFNATHHATQIATAAVLAVAGNSPLFLGRRLWTETRVALFKMATDDRPLAGADGWRPARVSFGHGWLRASPVELFAESVALHAPLLPVCSTEDPLAVLAAGGVPSLAELRLHHGTVWRWNRAVYDPHEGGHFRIEMRALPAGPTVVDMMANAAFLVGLTLAIAPEVERWLPGLTFGHARRNFYAAAEHGLGAELLWPPAAGERVQPIGARELADRLLPVARAGLARGGVDSGDADRLLGVIADRVASGQTGAVWQRQTFEAARTRVDVLEACRIVTRAYRDASATGAPVHTWSRG